MAITGKNALRGTLRKPGAYLMETKGEGFSTHDGNAVSRKLAVAATQGDLFGDNPQPLDLRLIANEDGLFPGMPQTWRLDS